MEDDSSNWGRTCGSVYGFFFFEDVDQRRECIRIVRLRDGMEP